MAKAKNNSDYSLLPGQASVFLDDSFVTKIKLKACNPKLELSLSLGVDPSIRIKYKPVFKYNSEHGLLKKLKTTTYERNIEVTNASHNKANILLIDSVPSSSDEKVKVNLLQPVLQNGENITLNKSNLEFNLEIEPSEMEEIKIKNTIDYPADSKIEFFSLTSDDDKKVNKDDEDDDNDDDE